ncbi:hypothetical protein BDV30DRAFT_239587 [Aspergillus minisclerotigenes]|uniref:Uncharacterized protein n=1 Tax=Aspergillus minisclerotigenes TaxID=656917 RepID=A0A5N6J0Z8_9EURO|nr:hypothetical protein BDV30DRAFT_239587 [Aspergillus minisclerotigenes]
MKKIERRNRRRQRSEKKSMKRRFAVWARPEVTGLPEGEKTLKVSLHQNPNPSSRLLLKTPLTRVLYSHGTLSSSFFLLRLLEFESDSIKGDLVRVCTDCSSL